MKIRITFFLLFVFFHFIQAQLPDRIEPPNWWTGMENTELQIMLYGKNIGQLKPKIKYKGITLIGSSSPGSPDYLFIDLTMKKNIKAGTIPIKLLNGIEEVATINYPVYNRPINSSTREGFNTEDVIYLLMPDRFANGDISNDNISPMSDIADRSEKLGRHGGDIDGIRQHLDYVSDLGFTSIWLNPVLENDMPRHSYHGYAITDFYKVDARLGTNESYKTLCEESSKKGIKVIMDMVANHCGLSHWWMENPPTDDWINYYQKPYTGTNHRKSLSMDPYASPEDKENLVKGWFVRSMPDLNTSNPLLAKYLIQNAIWWIEYAGLSGIRMDTYLYPDEEFISEWSRRIMQEYPNFNIAGEVWHDNPAIVSYWQKGKENANGYVSHLPALFDFPIQSALTKALMTPEQWDGGWVQLYEMLAQDAQYADPQNLIVFADNHDMSRIYTQLNEDYVKFQLALTYVLTARGIPQLFYGDEILMTNKGTDDHGIIRSDFPGGWNSDVVNGFTGKGLTQQQSQAKEFIQQLLTWRKNAEVIHHGNTMHFLPADGVYVFFRYDKSGKVMVVLNKNENPVSLHLDRFKSILDLPRRGTDILTGVEVVLEKEILITGPGPMVIEIK